jgi:hypothetical protein
MDFGTFYVAFDSAIQKKVQRILRYKLPMA